MADIFVSYDSKDRVRVQPLVSTLKEEGFEVFWDRDIPAGQTWDGYIGDALRDAACVIVAWSQNSIESHWVREEAENARLRGILVPILLDSVIPPLGFGRIHAEDLTDFQPGHRSEQVKKLVTDLDALFRNKKGQLPAERVARLGRVAEQLAEHTRTQRQSANPLRQIVQVGDVLFPQEDPEAHQFYDGKCTGRREISVPVKFDFPFTKKPKVVVSLQKLDLGDVRANIHRIAIRADNVRPDGFDFYFETWLDSLIYDAIASWTAVGE